MNLITPLHSLLLNNPYRNNHVTPEMLSTADTTTNTISESTSRALASTQQQLDFIHELQQCGMALIDIRGYNQPRNNINDDMLNHNRNDNHHVSDCSANSDATSSNIPKTVFDSARCTLDQLHCQQQQQQQRGIIESSLSTNRTGIYLECPIIASSNSDSTTRNSNTNQNNSAAHVYGYHPSGGMISTRYNMYREGFVFSDRHVAFDVQQHEPKESPNVPQSSLAVVPTDISTVTTFGNDCFQMFTLLHAIADIVLSNIGQHLQLPNSHCEETNHNNYIQGCYGPTIHHSQWHLKRYTYHPDVSNQNHSNTEFNQEDPVVLLPSHTDPSLISIVILDRPHIQNGAVGLQYLPRNNNTSMNSIARTNNTNEHCTESSSSSSHSPKGEWVEIAYSGHDVAIVFVGSILQYITNGYFTAVKHRVIYNNEHDMDDESVLHCDRSELRAPQHQRQRMAATLFCRPNPLAFLKTVPSPLLVGDGTPKPPPIITFEEWMSKTAKNYQKAKLDK